MKAPIGMASKPALRGAPLSWVFSSIPAEYLTPKVYMIGYQATLSSIALCVHVE